MNKQNHYLFQPVKKAIILAAGWGTRFLPLTKTLHKELLPVLNKPLIHYLAEEASKAGIEEIILVVSPRKLDVIKYFTLNDSLESELKVKGKIELLNQVKATNSIIKVTIAIQNEQLGLGHAISIASDAIKNEPFAVILGDDLIISDIPAIGQLISAYNQVHASIIGVQTVKSEVIHKYGVVKPLNELDKHHKIFKIQGAVEKPLLHEAPSNKALLGRYVFTPAIMNILIKLTQSWNESQGELNVIDAFNELLLTESIYAFEFEGTRYDLGGVEGFIKANLDLALQHPEIGPSIVKHLQSQGFIQQAQTITAEMTTQNDLTQSFISDSLITSEMTNISDALTQEISIEDLTTNFKI